MQPMLGGQAAGRRNQCRRADLRAREINPKGDDGMWDDKLFDVIKRQSRRVAFKGKQKGECEDVLDFTRSQFYEIILN